MAQDIPRNEERTKVVQVSKKGLHSFIDELYKNPNVISIQHRIAGANIEVTVSYAIMDLALHQAAMSSTVERLAKESDATARQMV